MRVPGAMPAMSAQPVPEPSRGTSCSAPSTVTRTTPVAACFPADVTDTRTCTVPLAVPRGCVTWRCTVAASRAVTVGLVATPVRPSDAVAVTRTASAVPATAEVTRNVDPVAPAIGVPFDSHCVASVTPCGVHVPVDAVSVCPTSGVPVMAGAVVAVGAAEAAGVVTPTIVVAVEPP